MEEPIQCPICYDDVALISRRTPCGHDFCLDCYDKWQERKTTCPLCRRPDNDYRYFGYSFFYDEQLYQIELKCELLPRLLTEFFITLGEKRDKWKLEQQKNKKFFKWKKRA
jgi:hypothetical protein